MGKRKTEKKNNFKKSKNKQGEHNANNTRLKKKKVKYIPSKSLHKQLKADIKLKSKNESLSIKRNKSSGNLSSKKVSGRQFSAEGITDFAVEEVENLRKDGNSQASNNKEQIKRKIPDKMCGIFGKKTKLDKIQERQEREYEANQGYSDIIADIKAKGLPDMSAWKHLYVPEPVLHALAEDKFEEPTPIQRLSLPSAIRDRMDIVGAAETGSGKTLAFGIPVIYHILEYKRNLKPLSSREEKVDNEDSSDSEIDTEDDDLACENLDSDRNDDELEGNELDDMAILSESDGNTKLSTNEVSGMDIQELGSGFGIDLSALEGEGVTDKIMEDEDIDLSPDEEDMDDLQEDELGCVQVVNDVEFDWIDKPKILKAKAQNEAPLLSLMLCPTRELAIQVAQHLKRITKQTDIKIAIVVGGMSSQKQERILNKCPEIVVATPGRLWELIQEGQSHLSKVEHVKYLVIDEADRMVQKGHFQELTKLLDMINSNEAEKKKRQTFVFSATLSLVHSGPERMVHAKKKKKKYLKMTEKDKLDALMAQIGLKPKSKIFDLTRKQGTAETLVESRIICDKTEKDLYLYYFLQQYPGRSLVFTNSKDCIRRLVSIFTLLQCCPLPLHADMHQKQRLKNLDRFKDNPRGFLLATDVAARGLDIPNVQHVIHYQVPRTTENYIHRSGRTARASKEGLSIMLVSPEDLKNYRRIIKTLNRDEELPVFPVESEFLPSLKSCVHQAVNIDKMEHQQTKKKTQNSWFEKAAKEMDIELDEDQLLHDLGDPHQQAVQKQQLTHMKFQLKHMLNKPLLSRNFSGKYPTKSGKLVIPYMPEQKGAVERVKTDMRKTKVFKEDIETKQTEKNVKILKKKHKYFKKKKFGQKLEKQPS